MATFSRQDIVDGLERLGQLAELQGITIKLTLVGVSSGLQLFSAPGIEAHSPSLYQLLAMKLSAWRDDVDISDARRLLKEVSFRGQMQDEIWQQIEPYLVPGDELTAQYAFQDLWETRDGNH